MLKRLLAPLAIVTAMLAACPVLAQSISGDNVMPPVT